MAMTKVEQEELNRLRAENVALKATQTSLTNRLKMTDKGCVQVTGINGKFGAVFYPNQWMVLLGMKADIEAFIAANAVELERRGNAQRASKGLPVAAAPAAPAAPADEVRLTPDEEKMLAANPRLAAYLKAK